jgi:hypothetical protein
MPRPEPQACEAAADYRDRYEEMTGTHRRNTPPATMGACSLST